MYPSTFFQFPSKSASCWLQYISLFYYNCYYYWCWFGISCKVTQSRRKLMTASAHILKWIHLKLNGLQRNIFRLCVGFIYHHVPATTVRFSNQIFETQVQEPQISLQISLQRHCFIWRGHSARLYSLDKAVSAVWLIACHNLFMVCLKRVKKLKVQRTEGRRHWKCRRHAQPVPSVRKVHVPECFRGCLLLWVCLALI